MNLEPHVVTAIARAAYEANRAYQLFMGDASQCPWDILSAESQKTFLSRVAEAANAVRPASMLSEPYDPAGRHDQIFRGLMDGFFGPKGYQRVPRTPDGKAFDSAALKRDPFYPAGLDKAEQERLEAIVQNIPQPAPWAGGAITALGMDALVDHVNAPAPTIPHFPKDVSIADDLANRYTYHAPKGDQAKRYGEIRKACLDLASVVVALTPGSREQSTALTKLDEVMFFANAAIARNET